MTSDHRRSKRKAIRQLCWIELPGTTELINCFFEDVSQGGARLDLQGARVDLPPEFVLRLTRDGKIARGCLLVWASDGRAGVKFTPRVSELRKRAASPKK
jgi:hypothetical protein